MPYSSKKTGKNKITVMKKDSGKVVGHTTPEKYNAYMAALHIHSGDKAAQGGVVEMPKEEFIEEHERLIPKLHGEEQADQMEELKDVRGYAQGGIVGPYPDNEQMEEESQPGEAFDEGKDPEFMAKGGYIKPPDFDASLIGDLTKGTSQPQSLSGLLPPPQIINQDSRQYQFTPGPDGFLVSPSKTPQTPLVPNISSQAKSVISPELAKGAIGPNKLPGMPVGITPDDIAGYINQQKAGLNKYGPEQQMALQQAMDARRNSLGYKLTGAGKGFADALMQGVARAGNPGFQQQFENQENQIAQERTNTLRGAQESNLQRMQSKMALDQMDPNSALSKEAQKTYAPLFEKLGYPEKTLKNMSASKIENAISLMTQFGGAEVQAKIKEYELGIEQAKLMGALGKQSSEEKMAQEKQTLEQQKQKADVATELLKGAKDTRFFGVPIPFTRTTPRATEKAARNVLTQQLNQGTPQEESGFIKTAINPKTGERVGTKDGKTWQPI